MQLPDLVDIYLPPSDSKSLQFISLGVTTGATQINFPSSDDVASNAISITGGFPFGRTTQTSVYVSTIVFACF